MPENAEAWELWVSVNTQWRVGAFSFAGLDYNALNFVADTLFIELTPAMLYKIQALERHELQRMMKGAKNDG